MANVSLKDNKNVIWEAYQQALKTIAELKSNKMDPMAEKEVKRVEAIIQEAERIAAEDVVNPSVISDYNTIKEAIDLKTAELQELTGIEEAVLNLVALVNAHNDIERNFAESMATRKAQAEQDLADIKAIVIQSKHDRDVEEMEYRTTLVKERRREKEEFEYNKKRERQLENDKWADEKATREKIVAAREEAAKIREAEVLEREANMDVLQGRVDAIPELIAIAEENGRKAGKAEAEKAFVFEKRALEANFKSEKSILENKISYYEQSNERLVAELEKARTEVAEARAEVKAIATEALNAAGNSKMVAQIQDLARDMSSNKSK